MHVQIVQTAHKRLYLDAMVVGSKKKRAKHLAQQVVVDGLGAALALGVRHRVRIGRLRACVTNAAGVEREEILGENNNNK